MIFTFIRWMGQQFLNGGMNAKLCMEQSESFEGGDPLHIFCILKKAQFFLKQVRRQWYATIDILGQEQGMEQNTADNCVFMRKDGRNLWLK